MVYNETCTHFENNIVGADSIPRYGKRGYIFVFSINRGNYSVIQRNNAAFVTARSIATKQSPFRTNTVQLRK